jgi:hypothetical protein
MMLVMKHRDEFVLRMPTPAKCGLLCSIPLTKSTALFTE